WLGLAARIYVPDDMAPARRAAIRDEGAAVVVVAGTYDDAVALAAEQADDRNLVIADTALRDDEDVPRWVIDGYSTILWEVDDELARLGEPGPDLVAVQIGVGALAAAVTRHYRRPGVAPRPRIVGVEPRDAACVLASVAAGGPVAVPGPHRSIMAGLNCGLPSPVAWPTISRGLDLCLAIDDDAARAAMRALAGVGIVAGETGAAGLGGLLALLHGADPSTRAALGLTPQARILVFNTEGATDPDAYASVVGQG
ncbi:MAG TPA: pyridoxal-phosphate dependent enzyme, partial [Thermomicrobiales bacterium]